VKGSELIAIAGAQRQNRNLIAINKTKRPMKMKTFKLCAAAAAGLMAFGVGQIQAQIGRLPFEIGDVQSLNIALTEVIQVTNYNNGQENIAKTKTEKLDNKGLLRLMGLAYYGNTNYFAQAGKTNYQLQISLVYYDNGDVYNAFEEDVWDVQVLRVVGTNKTVVLDTSTADAFVSPGQSNAIAAFDFNVANGPISGKTDTDSASGLMIGNVNFDFYYQYQFGGTYYLPFEIENSYGTMKQNFSGSSKGDKYSFTIDNISGIRETATANVNYLDAIITGGTMSGNGKDSGSF
jgi:hypothetical protein